MGKGYILDEFCCPLCGHLLPASNLNCSFCNWSLQERQLPSATTDLWDDGNDYQNLATIDPDVHQLFDTY